MDALKALIVCWLTLFAVTATAYSKEDPHYYKVTRKYKPSPVRSISFESNGAKKEGIGEIEENCAAFKLTERHVREFLRKAHAVSQNFYENEIAWEPCYAEGKVIFKNGDEASWFISPSQRGTIDMETGKNRGKGAFLYCRRCDLRFEGYYPPITTTTK